MQPKILLPLALLTLCSICTHAFADRVFYKGSEGPGKGKHLVLVASDHEYRKEETIPALARILSVHGGFDCTVVFGVTEQGEIQAGISICPQYLFCRKPMDWCCLSASSLFLPSR